MPGTRLQEMLAAVPLPMVLIDRDARIGWVNASARDLFAGAEAGHSYAGIMRQPGLLDAIEAARSSAEVRVGEFLHSGAQGERTFRATCAPSPGPDGGPGGLLVSFEDISQIEEASQMRQDFVANVSHELRTPLTALLGFIETLRGAARDDAAARGRFLEIMERKASRMNRLVEDLLSLSRVESEERTRPSETVDLAQLLGSCIQTLAPIAAQADARVEFSTTVPGATVPGDSDQLRQVFTNLIENALKYGLGERGGRKGGSPARVRVLLRPDSETLLTPGLRIEVIDYGEGVVPHHLARLTERFYRVDNHRSRAQGGTGLGLAIVKHIVNRHRGRLRITSTPGQGSRFCVTLPLAQTAKISDPTANTPGLS